MQNLNQYIHLERTILITDERVGALHAPLLPDIPTISIGQGETNKTMETLINLYGRLMELKVDRSYFLVGVGGGIVCDVAGFVASTFLRGLRFGLVPTTLLVQVDASVGGKNGVNLDGYKNMVGVIHQPEFVLCDLHLLQTLDTKAMGCGLAEIVKHAAIADPFLFTFLETHA
ncbi:MAG: 3-dehydroquinate synthase [Desulfohalobiaceae bacterium]|nr:3-dehydroquinate synthase [Desulfohalobiaceae bacterium]